MGQVFVKTLTGKTSIIEFDDSSANTILDIKKAIQEKEGVPVSSQRLVDPSNHEFKDHEFAELVAQPYSNWVTLLYRLNPVKTIPFRQDQYVFSIQQHYADGVAYPLDPAMCELTYAPCSTEGLKDILRALELRKEKNGTESKAKPSIVVLKIPAEEALAQYTYSAEPSLMFKGLNTLQRKVSNVFKNDDIISPIPNVPLMALQAGNADVFLSKEAFSDPRYHLLKKQLLSAVLERPMLFGCKTQETAVIQEAAIVQEAAVVQLPSVSTGKLALTRSCYQLQQTIEITIGYSLEEEENVANSGRQYVVNELEKLIPILNKYLLKSTSITLASSSTLADELIELLCLNAGSNRNFNNLYHLPNALTQKEVIKKVVDYLIEYKNNLVHELKCEKEAPQSKVNSPIPFVQPYALKVTASMSTMLFKTAENKIKFDTRENVFNEDQFFESLTKDTPDEIIDGLFLSNLGPGDAAIAGKDSNIQAVLRCTRHLYKDHDENITLKCMNMGDRPDAITQKDFDEAFDHIETAFQSKKRVLVYCDAGASRSPAFVMAYLMRKYDLSFKDAFCHVKNKRPCVDVSNFIPALQKYEENLKNKSARRAEFQC